MHKVEKKKIEWVIDLYNQLLDGGILKHLDNNNRWINPTGYPNFHSSQDRWKVIPTKKEIDMSVCIKSGIDCEFWDGLAIPVDKAIGTLRSIESNSYPYQSRNNWARCRPRMGHVHVWQGGNCPVPEGTFVKVYFPPEADSGEVTQPSMKGECIIFNWDHRGEVDDIVAFEVTGIHADYRYPWCNESD